VRSQSIEPTFGSGMVRTAFQRDLEDRFRGPFQPASAGRGGGSQGCRPGRRPRKYFFSASARIRRQRSSEEPTHDARENCGLAPVNRAPAGGSDAADETGEFPSCADPMTRHSSGSLGSWPRRLPPIARCRVYPLAELALIRDSSTRSAASSTDVFVVSMRSSGFSGGS